MLDMNDPGDTKDPMDSHPGIPAESGPARLFASTLWSVVLRAGSGSESESAAALERLCRQYWQPLYVFARRRGHTEHDAQDLTQGFLAELLAGNSLSRADPSRGRFRTFLLAAFCNHLSNQRRERTAQKRGGGEVPVSIQDEAEEAIVRGLSDGMTPEFHYERSWALAMLERVLARLRDEYAVAGRLELFEALQPSLTGGSRGPGYAELGRQVGLSEGTVAVAMHRMRRRYGEFLREEIAATVATPEEAHDELRHLLMVVSTVPSSSGSR
jgi:RNA polymerase sigma-70 factor (ECF subfamily)